MRRRPLVLRLCFPAKRWSLRPPGDAGNAVRAMGPMGRRQWVVATIVSLTVVEC